MFKELLKYAEAEGFKQGWFDAGNGYPKKPRPDIGFDLFQPGYSKKFIKAYHDAFETACEEMERQEALKNRQSQDYHEREY